MNEEELRKLMQNGFEKLRPHIEGMTVAMMDCYQTKPDSYAYLIELERNLKGE